MSEREQAILRELDAMHGEGCAFASDLADVLDIPVNAMPVHLSRLERAGHVRRVPQPDWPTPGWMLTEDAFQSRAALGASGAEGEPDETD